MRSVHASELDAETCPRDPKTTRYREQSLELEHCCLRKRRSAGLSLSMLLLVVPGSSERMHKNGRTGPWDLLLRTRVH